MQVYEHTNPDSLRPRAHPWTGSESDPAHQYYDFRARPELIRSSIEDLQDWTAYPATETFYRLLEWLNGPTSDLESNDCAFSGASANISAEYSKRLHCSGRLMIFYRNLGLNTSSEHIDWLTNGTARAISAIDPAFEWGAVGATVTSVRFITLPGPPERQQGQQLMLSFWAWGEDEPEVMTNLDRTLRNMTAALQTVSREIRRTSSTTDTGD